MTPIINIDSQKVGGLRFIKVGRFCCSFCMTATYKPFKRGVTAIEHIAITQARLRRLQRQSAIITSFRDALRYSA